jgi:DNA-binding CsgD family transcriptional regulator
VRKLNVKPDTPDHVGETAQSDTMAAMPRETALALVGWLRSKRGNATDWAEALGVLRQLVRLARGSDNGALTDGGSLATAGEADLAASLPDRAALSALGLTTAEIDIALALADGLAPGEIARQRGTSRHTVRNQIKSTLAKTDSRRQAELTALVERLRR